jgi:hypothetical protein
MNPVHDLDDYTDPGITNPGITNPGIIVVGSSTVGGHDDGRGGLHIQIWAFKAGHSNLGNEGLETVRTIVDVFIMSSLNVSKQMQFC